MRRHALTALAPLGFCLFIDAASADTVTARHPENVFTRMYADLPSYAGQTSYARTAPQQMGAQTGMLDAGDNLTDPIQSILNPAVFSTHNPDTPT